LVLDLSFKLSLLDQPRTNSKCPLS